MADGEQRVFMHGSVLDLLPQQLHQLRFRLLPDGAAAGRVFPDELPCCVRLYLESGALDYPFTLRLLPQQLPLSPYTVIPPDTSITAPLM